MFLKILVFFCLTKVRYASFFHGWWFRKSTGTVAFYTSFHVTHDQWLLLQLSWLSRKMIKIQHHQIDANLTQLNPAIGSVSCSHRNQERNLLYRSVMFISGHMQVICTYNILPLQFMDDGRHVKHEAFCAAQSTRSMLSSYFVVFVCCSDQFWAVFLL